MIKPNKRLLSHYRHMYKEGKYYVSSSFGSFYIAYVRSTLPLGFYSFLCVRIKKVTDQR